VPPIVSADEAVAVAWRDGGVPDDATSAVPIYAYAPAGGLLPAGLPVWLIEFTGVCFIAHGSNPHDIGPTPAACAPNVTGYDVVIDSSTGGFITGFTQG
jgi:hypothetical protein